MLIKKILLVSLLTLTFFYISGCNNSRRTRIVEVPGPTPAPIVSFIITEVPAPLVDPANPSIKFAPVGKWQTTPNGTAVWVPDWLTNASRSNLLPAAFDEIDRLNPERKDSIQQDSIPSNTVGIPNDFRVVIMNPGSFDTVASPTGLAKGITFVGTKTIYVAWVSPSDGPDKLGRLMPALAHEAAHAWVWVNTGDAAKTAAAGH